jgi:cytochrome b561
MAPMVIAQLLIGVTMIASLSCYPLLLAIHRPLGIAILVFAVVRLANRLSHRPPPFLATMGRGERRIATWSEYLLYALLLAQPLVGWAMLSAARFPIVLVSPIRLPGIAPHSLDLYAVLRECHGALAFLLFATFTAHVCAVLFHTLVLRDKLINRMALWPTKR